MTAPLQHISNALSVAIAAMEQMHSAVGTDFDTSSIEFARGEIAQANVGLMQMKTNAEVAETALHGTASGANFLAGALKAAIAPFLGITAVLKSIRFLMGSMDFAKSQQLVESQLGVVLRNAGAAEGALERLKETASEFQSKTIFGDEAMLGGAAELATYISDEDALASMMGTLTNYAAGMAGGEEVSQQQMVEYATQLGKALDGTYDGLRKKGFELSDQQKEIIENGTDMEKALVIDEVINQSWAGLAEEMAKTPFGAITQARNAIGDIREEVGAKLYPSVLRFFGMIQKHMPQIEHFLMLAADGLIIIIDLVSFLLDVGFSIYSLFADNWSIIAPILLGIAAAYGILNAAMIAAKIQTWLLTASKWALAAANWAAAHAQSALNAAMALSPLGKIALILVIVVSLIYAGVAAFNRFAGTSISATGVILGALSTVIAFLWNNFVGLAELFIGFINLLVNGFVRFANFLGNIFTSPVSAIIYLLQGMGDTALSILQTIASALDFVFGSKMADAVGEWRVGLKQMADDAVKAYAPNENYQKIMQELDLSAESFGLSRWAYGDAYQAGYQTGEKVDAWVGSLFSGSGFEMPDVAALQQGIDETSYNTGEIMDSIGTATEDLKYLKDLAERETINRFTTAEIKFEMSNTNHIGSNLDADSIMESMGKKLKEAMFVAAEGVRR